MYLYSFFLFLKGTKEISFVFFVFLKLRKQNSGFIELWFQWRGLIRTQLRHLWASPAYPNQSHCKSSRFAFLSPFNPFPIRLSPNFLLQLNEDKVISRSYLGFFICFYCVVGAVHGHLEWFFDCWLFAAYIRFLVLWMLLFADTGELRSIIIAKATTAFELGTIYRFDFSLQPWNSLGLL